ncbi:putative protein N(5)-glutamine methyltransferase [Crossiella cryophila]|uniref:peptide chain release factor N(5)-glutamine methyltransferase n=1 Tax=Crossiella cryophila TaxID=43355 RepID=A0A7W7CG13_9PSEU|nr:putative protein N(5)-glutamine methyltransferase [Crossiella cryophila]MBB4679156.1 release factor glutamine methyltransferase [Crossiella cryophila]
MTTLSARNTLSTVARLRAAGCVFAEDEARLILETATGPDHAEAMVLRRIDGEPLEHVLGWAEFHGLRISVDRGVFVPRRRTEFLVSRAIALAKTGAVVLDLCCGSGAVAAAIEAELGEVESHAADIDPAAVRCARRNMLGEVHEGDLYQPLPADLRERIDVLVANAPYVPTDAIGLLPAEARLHEPWVALDGGPDGLDVQRRVAAQALAWLAPGGHLLVETSSRQAPHTAATFARHGLVPEIAEDEDAGATVVIGQRPA